jgi:hypothetical protein
MTVTLAAGPIGWLPAPPVIGAVAGRPSWSFRAAPPVVHVRLAWRFVSLDVEAQVVDGRLHIDAGGVPSFLGLREPIEHWVETLDAHLAANGYGLAPLRVLGHSLQLQKVPLDAGR